MIRRPSVETKINHERWLVSYADFITLLFAFFVVMYSVSHVNEQKYSTLATTLQSAFSSNFTPTENLTVATDQELADPLALTQELMQATHNFTSDISVSGNEDWVEIELNSGLLFDLGKAELNPQAQSLLTPVAEILAQYDNVVAIEGHTDNIPISNQDFNSNWALSSARAVAVLKALSFQGVAPERLSAVAFGEFRPIADNDSAEGRERNRRVVIRVARTAAPAPLQAVTSFAEQNAAAELTSESTSSPVSPVPTFSPTPSLEPALQPVRLKGGGLLFTSDPNLPRLNPPIINSTPANSADPADSLE